MQKIEHIGIAVSDVAQAETLFETLLNTKAYKTEVVEREAVTTVFFKIGENKIELVAASKPESTISKFIEKKGPGIHHIAFDVANIRAEMKRLKEAGFQLLNEEPLPGADGKIVCFIHPKTAGGVLVELVQDANA